MKIEFKIKDSLKKKLQLDKKRIAENLEIAAVDEMAIIKQRTERGEDVDNKTFAPYVPQYAKRREKLNRRVFPPNLRVTGKMISAMLTEKAVIKGDKIETKIYFTNKTARDKALGNMKKRNFFSLSKKQIERIKSRLLKD